MFENIEIAPEIMLVGCCGAYCGICSKYQSTKNDHCPGCRSREQHPQCRIYKCCDEKKELFTCSECNEYPCERYTHKKLGTITMKNAIVENLKAIKKSGLQRWLKNQYQRKKALQSLVKNHNNGRYSNLFCTICQVTPLEQLNILTKKLNKTDANQNTKALKLMVKEIAIKSNINI